MSTTAEAGAAAVPADPISSSLRLSAVLENPERFSFARGAAPGPGLAMGTVLSDVACVLAGALAARLALPDVGQPLQPAILPALGLLAAPVGLALGQAMPRGPEGLGNTVVPPVAQAALGAALAILALGASCWIVLVAADALPAGFAAWLVAWATLSVLGIVLARAALRRRGLVPHVLILGADKACGELARVYAAKQSGAWRMNGWLNDEAPDAVDRIANAINEEGVDVLVVAVGDGSHTKRCRRLCDALEDQPVTIKLAVPNAALGARGRGQAGDFTLLDLHASPQSGMAAVGKRMFDVSCGIAALLALAPLLGFIALAIKLESPGPVLFRQWRFGVGNRPIQVLKFRTMRLDSCDPSGAQRTLRRDPRVTTIGRLLRRTSFDELPQLLNVLWGEMSLVGPRPHPLHMRVGDAYYFDAVEGYAKRHLVPPGITGWAQVNGNRGEVDTLEKAQRRLELDLWYIRNWSLALDARILLRTVLGGFVSLGAD